MSTRGRLCGQDLEGSDAWRPPNRAAEQIRADHQPQNRQGPRFDDPAVTAPAGRSGNRVMDRRALLGTLADGLLSASLTAEAQQPGRLYKINYMRGGPPFQWRMHDDQAEPVCGRRSH